MQSLGSQRVDEPGSRDVSGFNIAQIFVSGRPLYTYQVIRKTGIRESIDLKRNAVSAPYTSEKSMAFRRHTSGLHHLHIFYGLISGPVTPTQFLCNPVYLPNIHQASSTHLPKWHVRALFCRSMRHNKLVSWEDTFYEEMPNLTHLDITGNDDFQFVLMALPTRDVALQKLYGLRKISKKCKACPGSDLTRANVTRKIVLPQRACQYTPTQYLPMLDEYQERGVLLKGKCGTTQCDLMLTDVDPLRKIYKDKCWGAIRQVRGIEYTIGFLAITLNITVITVILASKILRGKASFLAVGHLALCDVLMGCFIIMAATGHEIDHDPSFRRWRAEVCPFYRTVFVLSQTMGAATSALVTIERYLAIVHAMNHSLRVTPVIAAIFLACSWMFAATMATLIQVIDKQYVRDNAMCILVQDLVHLAGTKQKILYTHGLVLALVSLYIVMMALYIHLYLVVKKTAQNAGVRREGKLAKRIGLIVFSNFIFFVVPNLIIVIFTTLVPFDFSSNHAIEIFIVKVWIPPVCMALNACINPFLFAFRNHMFVNSLKELLCRRQPRVVPTTQPQRNNTNGNGNTNSTARGLGIVLSSMATNRPQNAWATEFLNDEGA